MSTAESQRRWRYETKLLEDLSELGLSPLRKTVHNRPPMWDIWLLDDPTVFISVEHNELDVYGWVEDIRPQADWRDWVIFSAHINRATEEGQKVGNFAIMDADYAKRLIALDVLPRR